MGKNTKRIGYIQIIDAIHCHADKIARALILPVFKYQSTYYKFDWKQHRKVVDEKDSYLITGRNGTSGHFYTGLLPRVKAYIKKHDLPITVIGETEKIYPLKINYERARGYQKKAFDAILKGQRGLIVQATGTGKTFIAMMILKNFSNCRILYLVHTKDLYIQTKEKIFREGVNFEEVNGTNKFNPSCKQRKNIIVLAMVQSLAKQIDSIDVSAFFDIVIVDEAKHVTKENGTYGKILTNLLAPIRIGLEATPYSKGYEALVCEGLLGPKLINLKTDEAIKQGILVKPKIVFVPIDYQTAINKKGKTYADFYKYGIVKNQFRNKKIISISEKLAEKNKTVLIMVDQIAHGTILKKMFDKKKIASVYVQGEDTQLKRSDTLEKLKSKKIKIVIATKIWRESIDIPSLNCVINAAAMKDEKMIKQLVGRGLRSYLNKTKVLYYDFLDPYKYLSAHCVMRLQVYRKEKWI